MLSGFVYDTKLGFYVLYLLLLYHVYSSINVDKETKLAHKKVKGAGEYVGKWCFSPITRLVTFVLHIVTRYIITPFVKILNTVLQEMAGPIKSAENVVKKILAEAAKIFKAATKAITYAEKEAEKAALKAVDASKNAFIGFAGAIANGEKATASVAKSFGNLSSSAYATTKGKVDGAMKKALQQVKNKERDALNKLQEYLGHLAKDVGKHMLDESLHAVVELGNDIAKAVVSNPAVKEASKIINDVGNIFKKKNHDNNGPCGSICTPVQVWKDFSGSNRSVKFIQTFEKNPGKCNQPFDIHIKPVGSDSMAVQLLNACNTKFIILHENGDIVNTKTHYDGFDMPYTNASYDTYDAAIRNRHTPATMYTSQLFKLSRSKWNSVKAIFPRNYGPNTPQGRKTISGSGSYILNPIQSFLQDMFLHSYLSNSQLAAFCNKLSDDAFHEYLHVHHVDNTCDISLKLIRDNIKTPSVQKLINYSGATAKGQLRFKSRDLLELMARNNPNEFRIGGDIYSFLYTTFLDLKQYRNRFRYSEYGWPMNLKTIHVSIESVQHVYRDIHMRGHMDKTTDVNYNNMGNNEIFPFLKKTMSPVQGTGGVFTIHTDSGSAKSALLYVFMCTDQIMLLIWDSELVSGQNYRMIPMTYSAKAAKEAEEAQKEKERAEKEKLRAAGVFKFFN